MSDAVNTLLQGIEMLQKAVEDGVVFEEPNIVWGNMNCLSFRVIKGNRNKFVSKTCCN